MLLHITTEISISYSTVEFEPQLSI